LRDSRGPKPPRGHLVTVGWDPNGKDGIARVCPFQHVTYIVRSAACGVPIESVHLYDLQAKRAARVYRTDRHGTVFVVANEDGSFVITTDRADPNGGVHFRPFTQDAKP